VSVNANALWRKLQRPVICVWSDDWIGGLERARRQFVAGCQSNLPNSRRVFHKFRLIDQALETTFRSSESRIWAIEATDVS